MINHYIIGSTLTWITTLALVAFVFLSNKRSKLISAFCFYMINISAWCFGWSRMAMATDPVSGLFWARALHIGAIIIPNTFLHFTLTLQPESVARKWRTVIRLGYAITAFFLLISFSKLFVSHTANVSGMAYYPQPGPLYIIFFIYFMIYVLLAFWTLGKTYMESSGSKKTQMRYVFIAYALAYGGGPQAFMPVWGYNMWPYSHYGVPLCALVLTYAVLAHRLMDIVVLTRDAIVQALSLALSIFPFVISAFLAHLFWTWPGFASNNGPGPLICAVINFSLVLTMFTVYQNPHARRFSHLCFSLGVWNATALVLCLPETVFSVWIYRFGYGIGCLVALAWFHYWREYFHKETLPATKRTRWYDRVAWIIFPITGFTPLVLKTLSFDPLHSVTARVVPGPLHWLFSLWFLIWITSSGVGPILSWKKFEKDNKLSGLLMIASFLLALSAATSYFLFVQIDFPWYWYPVLEFAMSVVLMGTVLLRLPLEEGVNRVGLARQLGGLVLFTVLVPQLVGFLYTQQSKALIFTSGIIFLASIVFLMWRLKRPINEWVNQTSLFQKEFGHITRAKEVVRQEWNLDSLETALPLVVQEVLRTMPYRACTIAIMFDEQPKRPFFCSTFLKLVQGELIPGITWSDPLVLSFLQTIRQNGNLCLREETNDLPPLVRELDPLLFEAAAPITADGKIVGVVVLGPKKSSKSLFHDEDIKILTALAKSLSQRLGSSVGLNLFRCVVNNTLHDVLGHDIGPIVEQLSMGRTIPEDMLKSGLRKIRDVIRGLRSYAQGELEKPKAPDSIQMEILLETVYALHKVSAEKKGLQIRLKSFNPLPKPRLDSSLVERCVANLVTNAIKYTVQGSVDISAEVEEKYLVVCVADTGIGIPQESLDQIFNEGYRVPGKAATMAEGTGVGLSIVRDMMVALGGSVKVESVVGQGSKFCLYLPLPYTITDFKAGPRLEEVKDV